MKFNARIDPVWRPFLLVAGITSGSAFVDVTEGDAHFRFGFGFDETIARADISGAKTVSAHWYGGIGLRAGFRRVGLLGSRQGLVEIALAEPTRMSIMFVPWPFKFDRVVIAVEDPDALVAALKPSADAG